MALGLGRPPDPTVSTAAPAPSPRPAPTGTSVRCPASGHGHFCRKGCEAAQSLARGLRSRPQHLQVPVQELRPLPQPRPDSRRGRIESESQEASCPQVHRDLGRGTRGAAGPLPVPAGHAAPAHPGLCSHSAHGHSYALRRVCGDGSPSSRCAEDGAPGKAWGGGVSVPGWLLLGGGLGPTVSVEQTLALGRWELALSRVFCEGGECSHCCLRPRSGRQIAVCGHHLPSPPGTAAPPVPDPGPERHLPPVPRGEVPPSGPQPPGGRSPCSLSAPLRALSARRASGSRAPTSSRGEPCPSPDFCTPHRKSRRSRAQEAARPPTALGEDPVGNPLRAPTVSESSHPARRLLLLFNVFLLIF